MEVEENAEENSVPFCALRDLAPRLIDLHMAGATMG